MINFHQLTPATDIPETAAWLDRYAARALFSAGLPGSGPPGWVIENRDGTIVLAVMGDTLTWNGTVIARQLRARG